MAIDELLLECSTDTTGVGALVDGGLGQGLRDLVSGDVDRLVANGNTVLSSSNAQSLKFQKKD